MSIVVRERVPLAPYTTLGLGGPARYFCECAMEADVLEALALARSRGLEVQIIGGGSNVVFADAGFRGLVVKVTIGGVSFHETSGGVELTAGAGVEWDALVRRTVELCSEQAASSGVKVAQDFSPDEAALVTCDAERIQSVSSTTGLSRPIVKTCAFWMSALQP